MSWKSIIARAENLLGGRCPAVDLSLLDKSESTLIIERVHNLASVCNHKIAPVIYAEFANSSSNFLKFCNWTNVFSVKKAIPHFPPSMVIPLVGQCVNGTESSSLQLHRKMGEIFAVINFAITLHRTVVNISDSSLQRKDGHSWIKDMEAGNKLAVLAGDILLAKASLELASFKIPRIVEIISGAITGAICAEFTDLATGSMHISSPSEHWLKHVKLRHGTLLGECCAAATILSSSSAKNLESLLRTAREFGSAWALLSRLLSEFDFFKSTNIDTSVQPNFLTPIGFTESGLPEPTLADALRMASQNNFSICAHYKAMASTLAAQLRDSLNKLLDSSPTKSDICSLAKDSVGLLVKDIL